MRVFASGCVRTVKLAIVPCFMLALLIGCDSGDAPAVPSSSAAGTEAAPPKAPALTPAEKKKTKGAARAASGAQPAGAK